MQIDRDKAILKCQERLYESALNNVGVECKADEVFSDIAQNRIKDWLEELPSAERVGHWYDKNEGIWNVGMVMACSNCGESFYEMPIICGEPTYNYCPNCGAHMEGEEE